MDAAIARDSIPAFATADAACAPLFRPSLETVLVRPRRESPAVRAELGARETAEEAELGLGCSPVLLLHGLFSTPRTLKVLERRLRNDGYHVLSVRLGGLAGRFNTRRIDALAELVRARVERLYSRHPRLEPLTVIAHSKGGLVASYWVKRLGGHRFVKTVVTMGTPHRGTPWAWLGLPIAALAPSVLQMISGSAFIRRLKEGAWPAHVRLVSLYSRSDAIVPYPAAVVDAQGQPQIQNVEVAGAHKDFLLRRRIYEEVRRALRFGEDRPAEPVLSSAA